MTTYNSLDVAKYLLAYAYSKGIVLNVTKVQKLLYMAYGYFLATHNHRIVDEQPKAWPFGPVFPKTRNNIDFGIIIPLDEPSIVGVKSELQVSDALNRIVDKYSKFTAGQLSKWSHSPDGPWDKTTKQKDFVWNTPIPDEYIRDYFSQLENII